MSIRKNTNVAMSVRPLIIIAGLSLCQCSAPKNQGEVASSAAPVLPTEGTSQGPATAGSASGVPLGPDAFDVVLLTPVSKQPSKSASAGSKMPKVPAAGGRVVSETNYQMNGRKYLQQRIVIRENPLETEVRTIQIE